MFECVCVVKILKMERLEMEWHGAQYLKIFIQNMVMMVYQQKFEVSSFSLNFLKNLCFMISLQEEI